MRLCDLRDVYYGQDIYIVGTGPTSNLLPMEFFRDKLCLGLNDAYKMHPSISPIALMHHEIYSRAGNEITDPYHEHFHAIKYPIIKGTGRIKDQAVDWDHPHFYFYDWSHNIEDLHQITKDTDVLYYTPEGCSLHAALQICWIMGVKNIFTVGCDSRTFSGRHYARFEKNAFRDDEVLKRGKQRNYSSYIYGSLILYDFLRRKGINVFSLSPLFGYALLDFQYSFIDGQISLEQIFEAVRGKTSEAVINIE